MQWCDDWVPENWVWQWRVTLLIYTTIQSKLRQHLHPFLSSSPHHSQTANISLQSVLPITIINMSSNSIPLQSMSRWSLDSEDYDAHVNLRNQLHSQHPQLLPLARLRTMQSQPALNKSYAIGDTVLFEGSPEPYTFLGEKQIHWHNNGRQDGYLAEFRAPRELSYPSWSIQLILHHHIQRDCIISPLIFCHGIGSRQSFRNIVASDSPLSWNDLFWNCRWLASEPMKTSGWCSLVDLTIVLLYDSMFFSHDSFYFYFS